MTKKFLLNLINILALAFLLSACQKEEVVSLNGKTMGTTYHIKYIDEGKAKLNSEQIYQGIEAILQDVNAKMSTYIPDSELSLFNKNPEVNTPIEVSADLARVVAEAIELNQITQGALDVTVGPVVNLWGFGPEKRVEKAPTAEQIAERKAWVGIEKVKLTQKNDKFFLTKSVPQLYIDLSSIAKGFGVDKVADYIAEQGITHYLVEIGGEIRANGHNAENKAWQIAIEKPTFDGTRSVSQVIGLQDFAMATSGDYRNYFEQDGKRFSHEIDPKTCQPIQHNLASITVLSKSSMTADGLSTGLFVLGAEKALEVAEQYNLPIYLTVKTTQGFENKMSSKFAEILSTQKK
ncbi:thiamine biosynthesis protein ApbE [Canicola haemoglobinophilus]|uniref:FAD:protein FMN transferase n=1 Tax=Canicola haemoglobinophilus TaxID=733 RepID=A0A1V4B152_9PAST|nr:FAD:protein FMN transferase [Canicola haemoglobinophilus]OOS00444.1 thiamine biosynthesis protein ApbE [Canicola haemoglobinophilus]STO59481.1 thiamine biosynthesis lipoprotein [Canicola haemoglobinophilus]